MTDSWPPPPGGTPGPPWNPYAPQPAQRSGVPVWLIVLLSLLALLMVAILVAAAGLLVRNSSGESSSGDARVGEVASPSGQSEDDEDDDDSSYDEPGEGEKYVGDLEVGDCYQEPSADDDFVYNLAVVPCSEPHDAEVYSEFDIESATFPGDDETERIAFEGCEKRFDAFVGMAYADSVLDYYFFSPTPGTWKTGDRVVTCSVIEPTGEGEELKPVTGTLRGAKR